MLKYSATLLSLLIISGCAVSSLAELEAQALQTGDWSKVEKRERQLARRGKQLSCPAGRSSVCFSRAGIKTCSCVDGAVIHSLMSGHGW